MLFISERTRLFGSSQNLVIGAERERESLKRRGLPIACSIFTYAGAAKDYDGQPASVTGPCRKLCGTLRTFVGI